MTPTTHAAESADRFDPWGFGTGTADEGVTVVDVTRLGHDDEFDAADDASDAVRDLVSRLGDAPRTAAARTSPWPMSVPSLASAVSNASLALDDTMHDVVVPAPAPIPAPASAPAALAAVAPSAPSPVPATRSTSAVSRPVLAVSYAPAAPASAVATRPAERKYAGILGALAIAVVGQALYIGSSFMGEVRASAAPTGEMALSSHPAGAHVVVDGQERGLTPLMLTLPVGRHRLAVTGDGAATQNLDADVTTGGRWTRHLVLATPVAVATRGALRIDGGTPGASVWLDGTAAGRTPLTVPDLAAGAHAVRVQFASGAAVERRVMLAGGETVSLMLEVPAARAAAPTGPASGWVSVHTPFDVQVLEGGRLMGSSASERIMVTAGAHVFELTNPALGFTTTVKVVVAPGRTESLVVETPRTAVQVNAQPWAEVMVDGRLLGDTPLANLMLPIGVHQFVFKNPEFGERTQQVTVRLDAPNRVTADLRR